MKKIFTLISIFTLGTAAFSQVVFESDLSTWTAGAPVGWMGAKTNLVTAPVEVTMMSTYGAGDAQLTNATVDHKRFTTQPLTVTAGQGYEIKFWVKGQGDIRSGLFDNNPTGFGYQYNSYFTVNSSTPVEYTQTVTALATHNAAEFILSIKSTTGPAHLIVDSVSVTEVTVAPPALTTIYDIQYTTAPSGDSPEAGNIVTTSGIVTGVIEFGSADSTFFIQDGNGGWNGIYVYTDFYEVFLGDSVVVTGTVTEFSGLTELTNITNVTIVSSGNAQPTPSSIQNTDATQEQYESVLVKVTDGICNLADDTFGGFSINDGSGNRTVDDQIIDDYPVTPTVGNAYTVTGVAFLSFGEVKYLPRIAADIVVTGFASVEENTAELSIYPNPATDMIVLNVQPTAMVQIYAISGALVYEGQGKTIDVSSFEPGAYIVTVLQNETVSTQKLMVK
jgi:hypothetical protein